MTAEELNQVREQEEQGRTAQHRSGGADIPDFPTFDVGMSPYSHNAHVPTEKESPAEDSVLDSVDNAIGSAVDTIGGVAKGTIDVAGDVVGGVCDAVGAVGEALSAFDI